mgnify:CR=1 FL=1
MQPRERVIVSLTKIILRGERSFSGLDPMRGFSSVLLRLFQCCRHMILFTFCLFIPMVGAYTPWAHYFANKYPTF